MSNDVVVVAVGECMLFHAHDAKWFKAEADAELSPDAPLLCKVWEEVTYRDGDGVRDGSFRRVDVRRYWQDANKPQELPPPPVVSAPAIRRGPPDWLPFKPPGW